MAALHNQAEDGGQKAERPDWALLELLVHPPPAHACFLQSCAPFPLRKHSCLMILKRASQKQSLCLEGEGVVLDLK